MNEFNEIKNLKKIKCAFAVSPSDDEETKAKRKNMLTK